MYKYLLFKLFVLLIIFLLPTTVSFAEETETDYLGSTEKTSNATGTILTTTDYLPFGDQRVQTGGQKERGYIGERYDTNTKYNYLNARYNDPVRGQFISQDPVFWEIGESRDGIDVLSNPQAQNSYSYAGNNPIVAKDPSGRAFVVDDAAGFVVGGLVSSLVQAGVDVASRQKITWGKESGAFVTGGIIGVGVVNTPETLGASNAVSAAITTGLIGGYYGNVTKQAVDIKTGKQQGKINFPEAQKSGLITAGANGAFEVLPIARISGLSSGRGNMNAIGEAIRTKTTNGTITNISTKTATKSAIGSQAAGLYKTGAGGGVDFIRSKLENKQ